MLALLQIASGGAFDRNNPDWECFPHPSIEPTHWDPPAAAEVVSNFDSAIEVTARRGWTMTVTRRRWQLRRRGMQRRFRRPRVSFECLRRFCYELYRVKRVDVGCCACMVLLRSASHGSRNKLRLMSGPCVPIRVWGNVRNHTKDCKLSRTTFANSIDVGNASVAQHTNTNVVFSGGTRHGLIHFALFDRRDHLDVATWSVASGHLGGASVDRRSLTWGARARTRKRNYDHRSQRYHR